MFHSNEWKLRISGHRRVATFGKTKKIDSDFHGVRGSAPFIKCQTNWQAKEINRITLSNEWRSPSNVNIGPVQRGALSADTYAAPLQKWSFKPIFVPFSQHSGSGWSTWGWRLERTGFSEKLKICKWTFICIRRHHHFRFNFLARISWQVKENHQTGTLSTRFFKKTKSRWWIDLICKWSGLNGSKFGVKLNIF